MDRKASLQEELEDPDLDAEERADYQSRIEEADENLEALRALPFVDHEKGEPKGWHSGWKRLDKGIEKWQRNPGLMLYKLQTNAYKFSWLLIPLSVPFVALLFLWRRRFGLYDHAVFVTYSIAFMSLMGIVLTILGGVGVSAPVLLTIFAASPLD